MKTLNVSIACLLIAGLTAGKATAQGSLTPPGVPSPSMKTLEQVEPRTPISSVPCTINQSGSYYLITNLTAGAGQSGITVNTDDVTIDMMGFTLAGSGAGSGFGIYQSDAYQNLRVTNGKLVGWQGNARAGIYADGYNNQISNIQAAQNHYGIYIGPNAVVTECSAHENDMDGIFANDGSAISKCSVNENGGNGIFTTYGTISDCSARWNVGSGIHASGNSTITDCSAFGNHAKGISGGIGSTISDCQASGNWEGGICGVKGTTIQNCASYVDFVAGILVGSNCTVKANTCARNGRIVGDAAGIYATGPDNRIESNHVVDNDRGLDIESAGNYVADNTVKGNDDNYDIAQGNQLNILLCEIPETIEWPAKVVLAGNLSSTGHGIVIESSNVTVDMNGFSIEGDRDSGDYGIYVPSVSSNVSNAKVINGGIGNFDEGIKMHDVNSSLLKELSVVGSSLMGIALYGDSGGNQIQDCIITETETGMAILLSADAGDSCNGNMIDNCIISKNAQGVKLFAINNGTCNGNAVRNCSVTRNDDVGISLYGGSNGESNGNIIDGCVVSENGGFGIGLNGQSGGTCNGNIVRNNILHGNATVGIRQLSIVGGQVSGNLVEHNHVSAQVGATTWGISSSFGNSMFFSNTSIGHTNNFSFSGGDTYGPIVTTAGALGTTGADAHPKANYSR